MAAVMSKIKINKRHIFIIGLFLFLAWFITVYLSCLKGFVVNGVTGEPIKDAYVVTAISLYPWSQLLNVGGPNSETVTFAVAKSDSSGRFKIQPFFLVYFGFLDQREFVIYKTGYYARRFFQRSRYSFNESIGISTQKANLSSHEGAYLFPLQIESAESNVAIYALGLAEMYASRAKYDRPKEYQRLQPTFLELYNLFSTDSEQIKTTLWPPHVRDNWDSALRNLESTLDIEPRRNVNGTKR